MCEAAKIPYVTNRGTDYATQERQLTAREEKEGVEQWLEHVFFAAGEVTFLGLPAFFVLMDAEPNAPLKFAALFAWATLVVATGTFRDSRIGVEWPPVTPVLVLARFAYYVLVVVAVAYAGAGVDLLVGSPALTAAVAVALTLGAARAFPALARRLVDY